MPELFIFVTGLVVGVNVTALVAVFIKRRKGTDDHSPETALDALALAFDVKPDNEKAQYHIRAAYAHVNTEDE